MDENSLRKLGTPNLLIDFSSNDYLGFSKNISIYNSTSEILKRHNLEVNGATGSRLLTGNHALYTETESTISDFHKSEEALLFNSGYDANLGFFSSVPGRGDVILYDTLCHASIRDGIKMSNAKSYKFNHNDLLDFEKQLSVRAQSRTTGGELYIVTESIFSMDGNQPDLKKIVSLCEKYNAHLIIDEAHAIGVYGKNGEGLVQELGLENEVFARIITFGKALGCHGASVLCTTDLKNYLINFARSFIYTTALPPHSVATIYAAYKELAINNQTRINLKSNIAILLSNIKKYQLDAHFIASNSAIHCCVIPGNIQVKKISEALKNMGFDVKPILSPTVPDGQERLRICVHSFNTEDQIEKLVKCLVEQVKQLNNE